MSKILITGAGGYIGSIATYLFLQNNYDVVAVDNFSKGYKEPLEILQKKFGKDKLTFYEIDLRADLGKIFQKESGIEAVVHYGALCSVDESMKQPEEYFSNNVCGSINLISTMLKHDVNKIIFSSTCAVYGNAQYVPIDEKHPINPSNPYGESKRMMEKIIEWQGRLKGLNYVILRYFNVCGASDDGLIGDSKKPSVHLMQNAVRGVLGLEPFLLTYREFETTPDGSPIRDYTNVVDLNEAHLKALQYLLSGRPSEIINIGTGTGHTVLEIVNKTQEVTGKKFAVRKSDPREGEYDKAVASIDKAKKILNWRPKRSLEQSVKTLITWYNTHPKGWNH